MRQSIQEQFQEADIPYIYEPKEPSQPHQAQFEYYRQPHEDYYLCWRICMSCGEVQQATGDNNGNPSWSILEPRPNRRPFHVPFPFYYPPERYPRSPDAPVDKWSLDDKSDPANHTSISHIGIGPYVPLCK